jgi:hypothetical protein
MVDAERAQSDVAWSPPAEEANVASAPEANNDNARPAPGSGAGQAALDPAISTDVHGQWTDEARPLQAPAGAAEPLRRRETGAGAYASDGITDEDRAEASRREGVTGELFDMPSKETVQRVRAERELAGKLHILEDGQTAARPNDVTREEYENAVRIYSDLRMGVGNLTMNTDKLSPEEAAQYREAMMKDVTALLQTQTGRKELDLLHVNESGHHTTLEPQLQRDGARTLPDDESDMAYKKDGSTNDGSNVHLYFNPGCRVDGCRSDVVLAHEMVHAVNMTRGTYDATQVDATGDGAATQMIEGAGPENRARVTRATDAAVDKEGHRIQRGEHQAVGVGRWASSTMSENSYRRERQQIGTSYMPYPIGALDGDEKMQQRKQYAHHPEHVSELSRAEQTDFPSWVR